MGCTENSGRRSLRTLGNLVLATTALGVMAVVFGNFADVLQTGSSSLLPTSPSPPFAAEYSLAFALGAALICAAPDGPRGLRSQQAVTIFGAYLSLLQLTIVVNLVVDATHQPNPLLTAVPLVTIPAAMGEAAVTAIATWMVGLHGPSGRSLRATAGRGLILAAATYLGLMFISGHHVASS